MTESDLIADLSRLLREGLVYVDHDMTIRDGHDAPVARFALTARGHDVCQEGAPWHLDSESA
jgi:hypothetical protein